MKTTTEALDAAARLLEEERADMRHVCDSWRARARQAEREHTTSEMRARAFKVISVLQSAIILSIVAASWFGG